MDSASASLYGVKGLWQQRARGWVCDDFCFYSVFHMLIIARIGIVSISGFFTDEKFCDLVFGNTPKNTKNFTAHKEPDLLPISGGTHHPNLCWDHTTSPWV